MSNAHKSIFGYVWKDCCDASHLRGDFAYCKHCLPENDIDTQNRLISQISQELSAPLNAIIGFSEVLNGAAGETLRSQKQHEYIELIHKAAKHLDLTLRNMLQPASLPLGKHPADTEPINVNDCVSSVINLMDHVAAHENVKLIRDIPETVMNINADRQSLNRALSILFTSLIEMSDRNSAITVKLGKFAGRASISISNHNLCIPLHIMECVNSGTICPTISAAHTDKDLYLPWLIARNLIKINNGNMQIIDKTNGVTDIRIRLPLNAAMAVKKAFDPANDIIDLNVNRQNSSAAPLSISKAC